MNLDILLNRYNIYLQYCLFIYYYGSIFNIFYFKDIYLLKISIQIFFIFYKYFFYIVCLIYYNNNKYNNSIFNGVNTIIIYYVIM